MSTTYYNAPITFIDGSSSPAVYTSTYDDSIHRTGLRAITGDNDFNFDIYYTKWPTHASSGTTSSVTFPISAFGCHFSFDREDTSYTNSLFDALVIRNSDKAVVRLTGDINESTTPSVEVVGRLKGRLMASTFSSASYGDITDDSNTSGTGVAEYNIVVTGTGNSDVDGLYLRGNDIYTKPAWYKKESLNDTTGSIWLHWQTTSSGQPSEWRIKKYTDTVPTFNLDQTTTETIYLTGTVESESDVHPINVTWGLQHISMNLPTVEVTTFPSFYIDQIQNYWNVVSLDTRAGTDNNPNQVLGTWGPLSGSPMLNITKPIVTFDYTLEATRTLDYIEPTARTDAGLLNVAGRSTRVFALCSNKDFTFTQDNNRLTFNDPKPVGTTVTVAVSVNNAIGAGNLILKAFPF